MTTQESITRGEALIQSVRLAGALEATGTATGGSTSTVVDTRLVHPNTNQLKGYNVYIYDGAGQADSRIASAFTPGSDTLTVVPNFSATIDTSSKYILLKLPWDIQTFIDGLDDGIRTYRRQLLGAKVNQELVSQDILWGAGQMQRWGSGTAAAPDDWTLSGASAAVAQESTIVGGHLRYSAKLTSGGSAAAQLKYSVRNYQKFAGRTVDLRGLVQASTASRVTIKIDDGVSSSTSVAITSTDDWRDSEATTAGELSVADLTISDNPTKLDVTLDISSGGAVIGYFSMIRLILKDKDLDEYEFPIGDERTQFAYVSQVWIEDGIGNNLWDSKLLNLNTKGQEFSVVDREGTKYLRLIPRGFSRNRRQPPVDTPASEVGTAIPADRGIRLVGQQSPAIMTSDDDSIQFDIAGFLISYAAWYATLTTPLGEEGREGINVKLAAMERRWREALRMVRRGPNANAVRVYG